jgi:hypothetical protein
LGTRLAGSLVMLLALQWPGALLAHPDLDAGKEAFRAGDLRAALQKFDSAERSPELTEDDLVEVYWYRGLCQFSMRKQQEASGSFDRLLRLRPLYAPDRSETPPHIRAFFQERQTAYQAAEGVTITAPVVHGTGFTFGLAGKVDRAAQAVVFVRSAGDLPYQKAEVPVTGPQVLAPFKDEALWRRLLSSGKAEVVIELRNAKGTPVSRSGDAVVPVAVPVAPALAKAALDLVAPPPPPAPPAPKPEPATPVKAPDPPPVTRAPPPVVTPPPAKVIVLRPTPQPEPAPPVLVAPLPQPTPVAPPPVAVTPTPPITAQPEQPVRPVPVAPEEGGANVARMTVQMGAAVFGFVTLVGLAAAVVAAAGSAASWAGFAYTHQVLGQKGADFLEQRDSWILAFRVLQVLGAVLIPVSLALGGAGLVSGVVGTLLFVRSLFM